MRNDSCGESRLSARGRHRISSATAIPFRSMSASEQREAILTAALELFARFGFKKTSIDEIATKARIGKGTIYLHFSSKEELFGGVVKRVWGKALHALTVRVRRAPTPEAKVRAYMQGRVNQLVRLAEELGVRNETVFELRTAAEVYITELRETEQALLQAVLVEGTEAGVFQLDHPDALALAIQTALQGIDRVVIDSRRGPPLRSAIDVLCDVVIRGLAGRSIRDL